MKRLALKPLVRLSGDSKVLDIGSGNNCLDIATHLIDLMPESNAERPAALEAPAGKEFREGSIEKIPYPDRFFDFVHAAHILEHSHEPDKALSELMRVAPAGYIETPAGTTEQGSQLGELSGDGMGWDFHRWYVWTFPEMERLYLKPKTGANLASHCGCESGVAYSRLLGLARFNELDPVLPYHCKMTQFNWKGSIPHEIWAEAQQGSRTGRHGCDCMYAAFFAHARVYFASLAQLRRRWEFRRKFPLAFRFIRDNL